MRVFLVVFVVFGLIYFTEGLCIYNSQRVECNNIEGCIWSSPQDESEGSCYPNNDNINCNELYATTECGMASKGCCWQEFSDGFGCGYCSNITTAPLTPSPTISFIGDYCYCELGTDDDNQETAITISPTSAPTSTPTRPPTAPGAKKPKGSSECSAILGYGDCCCDKNYGQQTLTFINLDTAQRSIQSMVWYYDKPSTDPFDIICSFNCIDYGETAICNISGWDYDAGGNTRRKPPYDSFKTDTWFDIMYVGGTECQSYFHTSCSSDIVGYYDARDTNQCNVKCTAWTDANPNRIANCNNNLEQCTCDGNITTSSPITTSSVPITTSICTPTKNPSSSPTKVPTINPTVSLNPTLSPITTTTSSASITTTSSSATTTTTSSASTTTAITTSSSSGLATTTSSGSATTTTSSGSVATTSSSSSSGSATIASSAAITTTTTSASAGSKASTTLATNNGNTNRPQTAQKQQQQQAVIIGSTVGGVIGLIIIIGTIIGILFCIKKKRRNKALDVFAENTSNPVRTAPPSNPVTAIDIDPNSNNNVIVMTNNVLYQK